MKKILVAVILVTVMALNLLCFTSCAVCETCEGSGVVTCKSCKGEGIQYVFVKGKEVKVQCVGCEGVGSVSCPDCTK